jgi:hypothetical protein
VGDEPPVHIEAEVTVEKGPVAAGQPGLGTVASGSRVVHEPGRWSRLVAAVAVVAVVAGGALWWAGADRPGDQGAEEPESGSPRDRRSTRVAYYEALNRLRQAGAFAYRGDVHAVGYSVFRPAGQPARDVSVDGAVILAHDLSRDVAVDSMGRAAETVTSGPTVWMRSAATAEELDTAEWALAPSDGTSSLGTAAVALMVISAGDPQEEPPDAAGRRVIRGTMPAGDQRVGDSDLLAGAELVLTLDGDGDIARMVVASAPVDPQLRLELDITRIGEPQAIVPPDDGDAAVRRTIPVGLLEAAGVRPVELGQVPAGWKLTGAWALPARAAGGCPRLNLSYRHPDSVLHDSLLLTVTSAQCAWALRGPGEAQPLMAGPFQGLVVEAGERTSGDLDDGTTRVSFVTDLSLADAATVLASLRPFDPDAELSPIDGIPAA